MHPSRAVFAACLIAIGVVQSACAQTPKAFEPVTPEQVFARETPEQRAFSLAVERAYDHATISPNLRVRVLAARPAPTEWRHTPPEVVPPTRKQLADAAAGSNDTFVLALMPWLCFNAPKSDCDADAFIQRWVSVAPDDASAWLALATFARNKGDRTAMLEAIERGSHATIWRDMHAETFRVALYEATEGVPAMQRDFVAIALISFGSTTQISTLQALSSTCRQESSMEAACARIARMMIDQGSLMSMLSGSAILTRLPGTTPAEREQLEQRAKAIKWVLGAASGDACGDDYSSTACVAASMKYMERSAAVGEVGYAKEELARRSMTIEQAAAQAPR